MAYDVERDGPSNGGAEANGYSSSSGYTSSAIINPSTTSYDPSTTFVVRSSSRDRENSDNYSDRVVNAYNQAMYDNMIAHNSKALKEMQEWEEKMSNTAIQRQMADMKAAGINPILAGKYGGATYHSISPDYANVFPTYDSSFGVAAYEASVKQAQIHQQAEEDRTTLATELSNDKELQYLAFTYDLSKIDLNQFNAKELQNMKYASEEALEDLKNMNDIALQNIIAKNQRVNEYYHTRGDLVYLEEQKMNAQTNLINLQGKIDKELTHLRGLYGLGSSIGSTLSKTTSDFNIYK